MQMFQSLYILSILLVCLYLGHPHVGINGPVPPEDQPLAPPPMIAEGNARLGPHVHGARCYVCPWVWVIPSVSLICGIAGLLVGIIGFTKGMAIGFSVGVVVGALVGLLLYFLCKKCKRRNANYHPVE